MVGGTAEAVRERLVTDWWDARRQAGPGGPGVMIAMRVSDVEDLNARARTRLAAAGHVTGHALVTAAGREFQVGDRIVCLRNSRRLGVVNGTRATVTAIDTHARTLTACLDDERHSVVLPGDYIDAGHVTHGYAVTGHKAQGMTTSDTWVLGSEAIYREWGYVALSRGCQRNCLYVVAGDEQGEQVDSHGAHRRPADPFAALAGVLGRSRTQHMATPESAEPGSPSPSRNSGKVEVSPHFDSGSVVALQRERERAVRRVAALRERLATATPEQRAFSVVRRLLKRTSASFPASGSSRLQSDLDAWHEHLRNLDQAIGKAAAQSRRSDQARAHLRPRRAPLAAEQGESASVSLRRPSVEAER